MPLWLIPIVSAARKAAGALFGAVARNPWQAACIALLLASLWLWHGKSVALSDLKDCKVGRVADRKAYTDAQAAAEAKALAAKAAAEQQYKDKANEADRKAAQAAVDADARAAEYIRTHRVQPRAPSQASGTVAPTESGGSSSPDRSGSAAELVEVTADDIQVCTTNTTRLQAAREWALSLASPAH